MTNSDTYDILESIDTRLKWLLQLRMEEYFDEDATNQEKIKKLYQMGFNNEEMAEVVGTSEGSVRGAISKLRKEGKIQ